MPGDLAFEYLSDVPLRLGDHRTARGLDALLPATWGTVPRVNQVRVPRDRDRSDRGIVIVRVPHESMLPENHL